MFRPILAEGTIRPANTGRSGVVTWLPPCDSGRDRRASSQSHAGAANSGLGSLDRTVREAGYSDTGCDGSGVISSFNSLPGVK